MFLLFFAFPTIFPTPLINFSAFRPIFLHFPASSPFSYCKWRDTSTRASTSTSTSPISPQSPSNCHHPPHFPSFPPFPPSSHLPPATTESMEALTGPEGDAPPVGRQGRGPYGWLPAPIRVHRQLNQQGIKGPRGAVYMPHQCPPPPRTSTGAAGTETKAHEGNREKVKWRRAQTNSRSRSRWATEPAKMELLPICLGHGSNSQEPCRCLE